MQVERGAGRFGSGTFFAEKVLLAAVNKRSGHSTSFTGGVRKAQPIHISKFHLSILDLYLPIFSLKQREHAE